MTRTSSPSTTLKARRSGVGTYVISASSNGTIARLWVALAANTGTVRRDGSVAALQMPCCTSSRESVSSAKYFSIRVSSDSAAASIRAIRASSTSSAMSAGMSLASVPAPRQAFSVRMLTTPLKACSSPIGRVTGTNL